MSEVPECVLEMRVRAFTNNINVEQLTAALVHTEKRRLILSRIRALQNEIYTEIKRYVNSAEVEGGDEYVYHGHAGTAYALIKHAHHNPSDAAESLELATKLINMANARLKRSRPSKHDPAVPGGYAGVILVNAMLSHQLQRTSDRDDASRMFLKFATPAVDVNTFTSDEWLYGRAGYLCGCLLLRKLYSTTTADNTSSVAQSLDQAIETVAETIVRSGTEYASKHPHCPVPLMYAWHHTQYIGAAHGILGIMFFLLHVPSVLSNSTTMELIGKTLDWVVSKQDRRTGNVPRHAEFPDHENELVHFCHGAPGAVLTFMHAHSVFEHKDPERSQRYLAAAMQSAECVWQYGLLRKGPGICHGISGSAYVLLSAWRHTKNVSFVSKAVGFAEKQLEPSVVRDSRTPDTPFSLFEGRGGTLCLLDDLCAVLEQGASGAAQPVFPMFEVHAVF